MSRDCLPIWQVRDDDLEEARSLRARGASVTNPNEEGELPLVLACMNANLEMARWLRSEGADVCATDEPLSATDEPLSAADDPLSATDEPLSATDEPLSATDQPLSATDEPLRWLRTEGADVSATDAEGNCPAHAACMCSLRRSLFPQVNATDAEGNCPAHAACMAVSLPLCEWLKAEGARFDTVDRPGA